MFLLVSGRHVGAHPDGHQRGVAIQISINLGKTFLRISCIRKINYCDLKLGESVCLFTFFLFSESGLYLLNGFVFILILNGVTLKTSNILTWPRGFQDKPPYLVSSSLYPSLFRELRDEINFKKLRFYP